MKKLFSLLISVTFVSCSSGAEEVRGRPPGVVTSEQEDARKLALQKAKVRDADKQAKVNADLLRTDGEADEEELDLWSEDESISLWSGEKADDEKVENRLVYAPVFEVDGWPYQEPGSSFRLLWGGPKADVLVYSSPDLRTEPIGAVEFAPNERIDWDESRVAIVTPSFYTAKEDVLLEGFRITSGFLTGDEGFSATVKKGQGIQLLMYSGDGLCFVAVRGQVAQTGCPQKSYFNGRYVGADRREQMQPLARVWWVHFGGQDGGWLPLDNNYIVEIY